MSPGVNADVLVIGAGPVGLTMAGELRRHGVGVRLIDRLEKPREHPNAAGVHVRTLEILSAMGAVRGFLELGYPLPGVHVWASGKHVGFIDVAGVDSPFPQPLIIGQEVTERLLTENLERLGGRVERQIEAIGLEQDEHAARVRLRHLGKAKREEVVTVGWVIGCEGSESITRKAFDIPFTGTRYTGKEFLQIDARVRWDHPHGFGYSFITPEGVLAMFPYTGDGSYRIIVARNDTNPENREKPTLEEMQAIAKRVIGPSTEFFEPTWFNRFRSGHRIAGRFRAGRAFLAGDAGHVHVPIGGQGMNYGIHDAFNLAWKLAAVIKGEAKPALLDSYTEERHPADESLIKGTDRAFQLMVRAPQVTAPVLRLLGATALGLEAVQKRFRDTMAEMNITYRGRALSEDHPGSGTPAAGDRAPDALVVEHPQQEATRLFEIFHQGWTLLLFGGVRVTANDLELLRQFSGKISSLHRTRVAVQMILAGPLPFAAPESGGAQVLMDLQQYAHRAYDVEAAALYLIRPDGYIGFHGAMEHRKDLEKYLDRVFA